MSKNRSYVLFLWLVLVGLLFPVVTVLAQDGGVAAQNDTLSPTPSAVQARPIDSVVSPPRAIEPATNVETVSPRGAGTEIPVIITPTPRVVPPPTPTEPQNSVPNIITPENTNTRSMLWPVLGGSALFSLGYVVVQSVKNKSKKNTKKDKSQCFNLKQLLDKKLQELTDARGILESKAKDAARGEIREAVDGTSAGEMLALVEKAEKEYERLKKLYEECMVEFEGHMLKGVVVESSLRDKSILDKVKIEKTYRSNDWTLHDVLVKEGQIGEISKYLADGPWYIHFWEPGRDEVKVVFKDKVFDIKHSDTSTWTEAVAYGKSIGIKEEQLDFPIT